MTTDRNAILARAEAAGFPFVHFAGSQHLAGASAWSAVESIEPGFLGEIERGLAAHEAAQNSALAYAARERSLEEARVRQDRPLDFDDPGDEAAQEVLRQNAEAAQREAEEQLPMSRRQGAELVRVLRDVLAAIEKRGM